MTTRLLLRLLAVLGLAAASLVVFGAPAQACSCVAPQLDKQVDGADRVFAGTVVDVSQSDGSVTYDVEVDHSLKGDVAGSMHVATSTSSASCGLEDIPEGSDYLFFGVDDATRDDTVVANLCGGSAPRTDALVKLVEAVTGPGTTPSGTAADDHSGGPSEGPDDRARPDESAQGKGQATDAADRDTDDGIAVWPLMGGLLVIALAAGAWAARRTT